MTQTISTDGGEDQAGWRLTGRHVLALLIGFFGIIIATSVIFTVLAVQSFRGEDVKGSYRQGIDYNQALEARARQGELGWAASVNIVGESDDRLLLVRLTDEAGQGLVGMTLTGRLRHPADSSLDRDISFDLTGNGTARTDISGLIGRWTLEAQASQGPDSFRLRHDLDLR